MPETRYSLGEFERRFLLDRVPAAAADPRAIVDRYIDGTRLRLRTVEHPDGRIDRKLGHKRRVVASDPTEILHTSLYLDDAEFAVLQALPARELAKTRWAVAIDGDRSAVGPVTGSVDVFEGPLTGLVVLEVDLGRRDLVARFEPPPWAGPELTGDETFSGGRLAGASMADLGPALAAVTGRAEPTA